MFVCFVSVCYAACFDSVGFSYVVSDTLSETSPLATPCTCLEPMLLPEPKNTCFFYVLDNANISVLSLWLELAGSSFDR